jgi:AraC family transcriptional regulator
MNVPRAQPDEGRWRRGQLLLRSEEAGRLVPECETWLDGPAASPTRAGVRGYSYGPFEQSVPFATDAHVLVLYVAGRTSIQRVIGGAEEESEVGPGDITLHPFSFVSRWRWRSPIDVLHVYLEPAYLRGIAQDVMGAATTLRMRHGLRVRDDALAQLTSELIRELSPPSPLGSDRALLALGDRIALHLLRHHFDVGRADPRGRKFDAREMSTIRAWVKEHLGEAIHLPRLASQVNLGVYHFSHVFRSSFGQSPHDYVREQRLRRARELLLCSDDGVSSIALQTGFADQSHLTRCFKRYFGLPPGELRRRSSTGLFDEPAEIFDAPLRALTKRPHLGSSLEAVAKEIRG